MKPKKIEILEKILRVMAVAVLKRRKPIIVGITGSVGKTSAKEAIALALSSRLKVRKNEKNYNNEIGIPLTIMGAKTGGKNIFKWVAVLLKWLWVMTFTMKYPKVLVLELGIDRPGDMKYLMSFIEPSMAVVTNISSSHVEFFGSVGKIAKEKGVLVESVTQSGFVFLNSDDESVLAMKDKTKANIVTYGFSERADFRADRTIYNYDENEKPDGLSFKLEYKGKSIPVRLPKMLAFHQVYFALMSIAIGNTFKINPIDSIETLKGLTPPQGRMTLIDGIKGSRIIDDTYNASPVSTIAALGVVNDLGSNRRVVILGDMLELGDETERGHREVGKKVAEVRADIIIGVGERMKLALEEARKQGVPDGKIFHFNDPDSAAQKAKDILEGGDLVLVKGSQGMRMEKIVEALMRNSEEAKNILCRQDSVWRKKPFVKP